MKLLEEFKKKHAEKLLVINEEDRLVVIWPILVKNVD